MEFMVGGVEGEEIVTVKKMNNKNTRLILPYGSMLQ
jgi:hypothetical protein